MYPIQYLHHNYYDDDCIDSVGDLSQIDCLESTQSGSFKLNQMNHFYLPVSSLTNCSYH